MKTTEKINKRGFKFNELKNIIYNLLTIGLIFCLCGGVNAAPILTFEPPTPANDTTF